MTTPTDPAEPSPPLLVPLPAPDDVSGDVSGVVLGPDLRPGSRAARMRQPLARDVLRAMAEQIGVCISPVLIRRTDAYTGQTNVLEIPCGASLEAKCKPCAIRHRRLRLQQIRDGWHLCDEPLPPPDEPTEAQWALVSWRATLEYERADAERCARWDQVADLDEAIVEADELIAESGLRGTIAPAERTSNATRSRSTKRRQDVPDLPRLPVENRTVGRVYAGKTGRTHRPSMLLTLTLGSYGAVHSAIKRGAYRVPCECGQTHYDADPLLGTPVDPATYDYRSAALDAIHFARLLDRWWQNTRRAAGWKVQYAGAVELQKRLTPHAHFCLRGTLPRKLLRQIAAATYHQVWWPPHDTPVYTVTAPPEWDPQREAYVDPKSREPLTTWEAALAALDSDPEAQPAHVVRMGRIDPRDIKGVEPGSKDAERSVRYVTKYITKDLTAIVEAGSDAQRAHFDRLHAELSVLPCSPTCANWLLYGVQPDHAKAGLIPGRCKGKVHQRATLGFTGRRVLISRQWSNKTLADIRADNRAWVRAILGAGEDQGDTVTEPDQPGRYRYGLAHPDDPDVPPWSHRILAAIHQRIRNRAAFAKARGEPPGQLSATDPPGTTEPPALAA